MRAYFFVNAALKPVQHGLQVAHCMTEMAIDARSPNARTKQFFEWAISHKTIIVLEGGLDHAFHKGLVDLCEFLKTGKDVMWASFTEDEETMNRMMTCVGVIVPEEVYERAQRVREKLEEIDWDGLQDPRCSYTDKDRWEAEFIRILNSCPLAR
jgi:hypothetical protein